MKNLLLLTTVILFVGFNSSANAQWYLQNNPSQNNSLRDIFVFDENNAIVVGDYGTILRTIDGGENWLTLPHDTTDWLCSVYFVNDSIGWIAGNGMGEGPIQKTTDGGNNWISQFNGGWEYTFYSVNFVDENNGWAVGVYSGDGPPSGIMYKTTDGGINWIGQSPGIFAFSWSSVFFINIDTGWVVSGIIGKTTNGGENWVVQLDSPFTVNSIYFIDEFTGWAAGYDYGPDLGIICKTTDGGENWISQLVGGNNILNDIFFVDENTGWAVGSEGIILNTTDGGINWINQPSGTTNELYSVNFANESAGWAVGENGTILKTTNGGGTVPVELTSFTASAQSGYVKLNWSTATETNNRMFEIERRQENSDFVLIGFVEGNGTTTERQEYSYIDRDVTTGKYYYRLKQIDFDGTFEYSSEIEVDAAPTSFSLEQNYPNPFNPSTKIKYSIPSVIASGAKQSLLVTLKVYDVLGNEVATLVNEEKPAGIYEVTFNASGLSSGVYFYSIRAGDFVETKKMILIR